MWYNDKFRTNFQGKTRSYFLLNFLIKVTIIYNHKHIDMNQTGKIFELKFHELDDVMLLRKDINPITLLDLMALTEWYLEVVLSQKQNHKSNF